VILNPGLRTTLLSVVISISLWSCSSDDTAGTAATAPDDSVEPVNFEYITRYTFLLELQVAGDVLDHAHAFIRKRVTWGNPDDQLKSIQDDTCVLSIDDTITGFPQRESLPSNTHMLDVGPSLELSSATDVTTVLHRREPGVLVYSIDYGEDSAYNFPYSMIVPDIDGVDFHGEITASTVPQSSVVALSPTSSEVWNSSEPVTWVASELPDTYIELQIFSEEIFMDCWLRDDGYFEGWQSLDNDFTVEASSLTLRRVVANQRHYGNSSVLTRVRRLN